LGISNSIRDRHGNLHRGGFGLWCKPQQVLIFAPSMEFNFHTLPNGLRIVHKPTANGQVAHFGLTINAGSRDELESEQGLAHFLEHCFFKGTKKRKAFHILSRMDSVGAELNAYTTKEETVLYASFLKEHCERAMELISDIVTHSTFPEKEIAKERDVIVDEILSYQDSPAELIFDDFEELVFGVHPIGRNILGTQESVQNLKRDDLSGFISRRYRANEMVLSTTGDVPFRKIVKWAEKYFMEIPSGYSESKRLPVIKVNVQRKAEDMDTFQAHLVIGGPAYDLHHEFRIATTLLNNYIGGPAMNSRLNMNIRERHGIAYNIESNYQPYSDTGLITIYLGTDKKWLKKSEALILKELKSIRENRMTSTALHRTKEQLKGQMALSSEGGVNMMQAIGKSLLSFDKVDTTGELLDKIDAVTSSQLMEVANHIFNEKYLSTLIYK
jgi:predicted Zn-dependent peptidase